MLELLEELKRKRAELVEATKIRTGYPDFDTGYDVCAGGMIHWIDEVVEKQTRAAFEALEYVTRKHG